MKIFIYLFIIVTNLLSVEVFAQEKDAVNNGHVLSNKKRVLIQGVVVSEDNEKAIPFATVGIEGTKWGVLSDEYGRFEFKAPAGKYKLSASAMGFDKYHYEIAMERGDSKVLKFILKPSVLDLEEVVVKGKTHTQALVEQGFAVRSVNTQKSMETSSQTVELLNRVSGVKIRQNGGVGSNMRFYINGLSGNSVRVFIDGVPASNYGSSFSVANLPPSMIDRIDVYKGVIPAFLSDDALGGAINVVLKRAALSSINTSYSFGSYNTHRFDVNGMYRNEKSGFSAGGSAYYNYSDNNYKVWGDAVWVTNMENGRPEEVVAERFHDKYRSTGVTARVGYTRVKWADEFMFETVISDMKKDIQHGATMATVYGNREAEQTTYMGGIRYSKRGILPKLDLSFNASYSYSNRLSIDTSAVMYSWLGKPILSTNGEIMEHNNGGEAGNATLNTNLENNTSIRAQLRYEILPSHNIILNGVTALFSRDVEDPLLPRDEQERTETRFLNKVIGGATYEGRLLKDKLVYTMFYKHYYQEVKLADPQRINGVMQRQEFSNSISAGGYGGTLSYKLTPTVALVFSAEKAMRLPSSNELLGNHSENIEATYELEPEQSINMNIGVVLGSYYINKHSFGANVNFFDRDVKDMIKRAVGPTTDDMYAYENLGKVRSSGVDLDLNYSYDEKLMLTSTVSYSDARFNLKYDPETGRKYEYYGSRLRNTPFLTSNSNIEYNFYNLIQKGSRLSLNYNFNFVYEFLLTWDVFGSENKSSIPSQYSHDIGAVYSFPKEMFSLSVDVKNMFDTQQFDNWALQKPGRGIYAKLTYNFN